MRLRIVIRSLVLAGLLAASARGLSAVHVDFQVSRTTGVTAPGYVAIDNTTRWDQGTQVTLDSGVQGGWTAYVRGSGRDRGTADPLLRDLMTWTNGTTDIFKITGLQPGSYTLTVYSYDPSYPASTYKTGVNIDGNNDGVYETSQVILQSPTPVAIPVTVSSGGILFMNLGCAGASAILNGFDLAAGAPDTEPPAAITDLSVTATTAATASLRWTAPTDNSGKAASYNIRYSTSLITDDASFNAAAPAAGAPVPANPGLQENFTVAGLSPATQYYFAIKSADASGNVSALSYVATGTTQAPDTTAPAAVTNLAATAIGRTQLTLTWTASGDDGSTGTAASYNVRYATSPITDATFATATAVTGLSAPKASGSAESVVVTGLQPGTTYWFALKVADEVPNWSALSNLLEATTLPPDVTPPSAVTNLSVATTTGSAAVLQWTAPADDSGSAASYDVRYSTSPITAANWAGASQATAEPVPATAGQAETFTVTGLAPTTKYYFAVKSADASGNVSALSNVPSGTTLAAALRSEVHVDFQGIGGVAAVGYVVVTDLNRLDNGTWVDLGGGVKGGWTALFAGSYKNRTTGDAVTRDFLLSNRGGAAQTFQMRGVQPGTYNLKIYSTDTDWHTGNTIFTIDQNNDGIADTTLTISNAAGESAKTVQVTVSMAGIVSITMSVFDLNSYAICNGFDLVAVTPDPIPPAPVVDLSVTSANSTQAVLAWTAPADDNGLAGRVGSYDIRYSISPIDATNWDMASKATGEPTPAAPGQPEIFTVSGLAPDTTWYFAVKALDFDNNAAPLSNVPSGKTEPSDLVPPAAVTDLEAKDVDANWLTLTWTASGDDADTGTAGTYDLRYATSPITDQATFAAATPLAGLPAPKIAGTRQSFLVSSLTGGTTYWFALKVADEMPGWSPLSNVVQVTTLPPDVTPPAAIADLAAADVQSNMVTLTWTAPGDDGSVGTAVSYEIRYSTTPITDDATFAAAEAFTSVPVPQTAGTVEHFLAGGLQPGTTYYIAIKSTDNGVPANPSALSNVVQVAPLPAGALAYGVSNEFSLDPVPSSPYAPAIPATGSISITNISVDPTGITRTVKRAGPVYTGVIHYDLATSTSLVHVWLELSTDGGITWSQRRIHGVGAVGTIGPGTGLSAQWLVDGDHGNRCRIRIRVNGNRATYSNFDADNNKYPRPAPWDEYPTIERMTDLQDFNLTDARYTLPHVDFYKSLSAGQMKAGFARVPFFNTGGNNDIPNPQFFLHACYLESMDGQQKYLILQADSLYVMAEQICGWRDQINAAYGIPKDHITVMYTHVHNGGWYVPGVETFPLPLVPLAMANAQPVEIGWLNKDMGTSYNTHRNIFVDPTHADSSYDNYVYGNPPAGAVRTDVIWEYDAQGNIIGGILDGRPWNSPYQKYFDNPLDSYLQMIVFRNVATHAPTGVIVKFTTHPVNRDYYGDLPRCVMDTMQAAIGSNVEVMWTSGFCGNSRPLAGQAYPASLGSPRIANAFTQALVDALPSMEFTPLTKMGTVIGYDLFGDAGTNVHVAGSDPERVGSGVRVWRLNDIYFSTLPSEAPQEQGLYIRGRTSDLKHMYNAYGDGGYLPYYCWGRWWGVQMYEKGGSTLYDTFRMAQEITRGVDILEQSVDALRLPGDVTGDGHVDVVDLLYLVDAFGSVPGDANYDSRCDFNSDASVDVFDLLTMVENFGT